MPQLGETVTEGTITRWLKQVGERVEVDEPLFEVSTDKVDSEVPAPAAGSLTEILVPEGETVDVGARLAVLGDAGAAPAAPAPAAEEPRPQPAAEPRRTPAAETPPPKPAEPVARRRRASRPLHLHRSPRHRPLRRPRRARAGARGPGVQASPIVRRLATDRGVDLAPVRGTGDGGRVTRNDVLAASSGAAPPAAPPAPASPPPAPAAPARRTARGSAARATGEPRPRATGDEVIPFDNIRRRTAEHVVRSKQTSAHVYTSVEVDFERVDRVRREHGAAWKAREGFSLTYLPFIARGLLRRRRRLPAGERERRRRLARRAPRREPRHRGRPRPPTACSRRS